MSKDAMAEHSIHKWLTSFGGFFGLYIFIELDEWWNSICVCSVFKGACCLDLLFDVYLMLVIAYPCLHAQRYFCILVQAYCIYINEIIFFL
jgi:hypothetical protein